MNRALSAVCALTLLTVAGAASAQNYGQPVYLNAYGRPVGGSPLSEVETRTYVETGRWADGYADRPRVVVPGQPYGHGGYEGGRAYGYDDHARGRAYGDPHAYRPPYAARSRSHIYRSSRYARLDQGYRDEWRYNDDRPRTFRGWSGYGSPGRRHDACGCGCGDVYLYDR